ncbi:MAG: NUDIX domain-containing protein [Bacteroidetes bacterium]|nr:NUDIX domain-containing protein [Bacteroidota bacterium]
MTELWDIYDAAGKPTGEVLERTDDILPAGKYHVVVHIWLYNDKGEVLIQKRAPHVFWMPGKWATTGGSVISGEDSKTGALREVQEELGITLQPSDLKFISRVTRKSAFTDIYVAKTNATLATMKLEDAVDAVKYVNVMDLHEMIDYGHFVDYMETESYTANVMQRIFDKVEKR